MMTRAKSVSVLVAAMTLLVGVSMGVQNTYNINFVSEEAVTMGGAAIGAMVEGTIGTLGAYGATFVSSITDGATYSVTVEETMALTGTAICNGLKTSLSTNNQVCLIDNVTKDGSVFCTISEFEEYAEKCISATHYYLTLSPDTQVGITKEQLDNFISSAFPAQDFSSDFNETHYTAVMNETAKGTFGLGLCSYWNTSKSSATNLCFVASVSDGEREYCKPSEDEFCKTITGGVETEYEIKLFERLTKDKLDSSIQGMCSNTGITFINSTLNLDIYKFWVQEPMTGAFGEVFNNSIKNTGDKCKYIYLKSGDTKHYTFPEECYLKEEYEIKLSATEGITKDELDSSIQGMCQDASTIDLYITLINSTLDNDIYKFYIQEPMKGGFGEAFNNNIKNMEYKCGIVHLKSGDRTYYTRPDECAEPTEYEIKLSATGGITKNDLDNAITEMCSNTGIGFINSTFDNDIYKFYINEPMKGGFGEAFNNNIKNTKYKCGIVHMKSGDRTYYTRPDECDKPTRYDFALAEDIPTDYDKVKLDGIFVGMVENYGKGGLMSYVSSNFTPGLYTMEVKEAMPESLSEVLCGNATNGTSIVKTNPTFCYITSIILNGEAQCHPNASEECKNAVIGVNTTYDVKLTNDVFGKDDLDAIFEGACQRFGSLGVRFVGSEYDKSLYSAVVTEPVAGVLGEGLCEAINSNDNKCYFEYLRAGGVEYCNRSSDCPAIQTYVVTFLDGGIVVKKEELRFNDEIVYPKLNKAGYLLEWDSNATRMPGWDLNISAVWVPGHNVVEIIIETNSFEEEDIEKIIQAYTSDDFVIEKIESGGSDGSARVIIRFITKDQAIQFVNTVKTTDEPAYIIRSISFLGEGTSYSHSLYLFPFLPVLTL